MNAKLDKLLENCDDVTADAVWAILRYKNIGILRKMKCICKVLELDHTEVLQDIPKDEKGRYLDKPTRNIIHNALIKRNYEHTKES